MAVAISCGTVSTSFISSLSLGHHGVQFIYFQFDSPYGRPRNVRWRRSPSDRRHPSSGLTASHQRQWFADLAAWQWESKRDLIDGCAQGDVAIFGTSVLFHGLDPSAANSNQSPTVVNLALNGALQHQTQLLRERLSLGIPSVAVLVPPRESNGQLDSRTVFPILGIGQGVSRQPLLLLDTLARADVCHQPRADHFPIS